MTGLDFHDDPRRGCAPGKVDPDDFFPERGGAGIEQARDACGICPFTGECLDRAIRRREEYGVWGGVNMGSLSERRAAVADHQNNQVALLWEQGLSDTVIALRIGRSPGDVNKIRNRLELPALYGPGGRRTRAAVAA